MFLYQNVRCMMVTLMILVMVGGDYNVSDVLMLIMLMMIIMFMMLMMMLLVLIML